MSDLAGQLEIRLDARGSAVTISSSRPLTAARVFAGKSPAEVVRQLPTLFSLCGTAQAAACVGACEQALGRQPSAAVLARRQALVYAETIKEHLWRLLLDWPQMVEPRDVPMAEVEACAHASAKANAGARVSAMAAPLTASAMPRVMRAFMALRQAQQAAGDPFTLDAQQAERGAAAGLDPGALLDLVAEQALGAAPGAWLAAVDGRAALQGWAEQTQASAAGLVRAVMAQGLAGCGANSVARLPDAPWRQFAGALASADADAFIAAPQWRRRCAETGPLARVAAQPLIAALLAEHGNGLLTRLVALLVDLARSARGLEAIVSAGRKNASAAVWSAMEDASDRWLSSGLRTEVGGDGAQSEIDAGIGMNVDAEIAVGAGAAEAARGLLMHRVRLAQGRVAQYQILAPTEWNFHPEGVVAQGLAAIARGGTEGPELERLARLYITAVDPCVDYRLSVS